MFSNAFCIEDIKTRDCVAKGNFLPQIPNF